MPYDPEHFSSTYEKERGPELWEFLNTPDNVIRMETAIYLSRPGEQTCPPRRGSFFSLCKRLEGEGLRQRVALGDFGVSSLRLMTANGAGACKPPR